MTGVFQNYLPIRSLIPGILLVTSLHLPLLESQEIKNGSGYLKSLQGTWVFAEKGADLWLKVVIKGNTLTGYAGYPNSGKFVAESTKKIKIVKLKYGRRYDPQFEIIASIGETVLSGDRIYSGTLNGIKYISIGDKNPVKLMNVPNDFDPWK